VVIEFARGGSGPGKRAINLKHSPGVLPPQLQVRGQGVLADGVQVATSGATNALPWASPLIKPTPANTLQGRVAPATWQSFMQEVERLAGTHPYVVKPSAGRLCSWAGGAVLGACTAPRLVDCRDL